jgi:hypothetical protein
MVGHSGRWNIPVTVADAGVEDSDDGERCLVEKDG